MELWKDSLGEKLPSDCERRRSAAAGFPRLALSGEHVYMRLNSVLKACSLLGVLRSEDGQDAGLTELEPTEGKSWPEGAPGREKSSEFPATGLSRLEESDRLGKEARGASKSG